MLEQGEYELGCYRVQHARWTVRGWDSGGPWMRAVVTNQRLLLAADGNRPYFSPISITPTDLVKIWNVNLGRRNGVIILLKKRRLLYLLVDWGLGSKLVADVKEMIAPPVKPRILPHLPRHTS
jgi:hypothetical protein